MIGEKFYISLSVLNVPELNALIRYSANKLINKREDITNTLKLFKVDKDLFYSYLNDEEIVFAKIFGSKATFDKKSLIDHFHYCLNLYEKFAVQISIDEDKELQLKTLELFYRKRGLQKESSAINTKLITLTRSKDISFKSYLSLYELYVNRFLILVNNFSNDVFENIVDAVDNLDKFYFIAKLHWGQELEVLSKTKNFQHKKRCLNQIRDVIANDEEISNKLLFKIYTKTYALYSEHYSLEEYKVLKGLILDNLSKFDRETKKQFLTDLSNYISYLYSTSADTGLLSESFEISKIQIKLKTLIEDNKLPEPNFSSILRVALYLKEYEWAKQFIEDSTAYIDNEDLILKNKAELFFVMGDLEEALNIISVINLKTFGDNYEIKTLYAKILFQKEEYDLLENHLNTYELYLRRNKEASAEMIDRNLRFVLYFKRLLKNLYNPKKIEKLNKDVAQDLIFFYRNWLLIEINKRL